MKLEQIKKDIAGLKAEYEKIRDKDYSGELERLDNLTVDEGNRSLKNYIRQRLNVINKSA